MSSKGESEAEENPAELPADAPPDTFESVLKKTLSPAPMSHVATTDTAESFNILESALLQLFYLRLMTILVTMLSSEAVLR
jgi:hypothetical protein